MGNMKWKIGRNDLKSATLMLEYNGMGDDAGDIVAIPIGDLSPATLVRLSSCDPEDMYDILFQSNSVIFSPISMSSLMTSNYDDMSWNDEDNKVRNITLGALRRVSLNVMRGNDDVFTLRFPNPDEEQLGRLFGE